MKLLKSIPNEFYDLDFRDIKTVFPEPTLIELEGLKKQPLFVSILLHGNEYTGLKVMQTILKKYQNGLPRSIFLMIGNVDAAQANKRCLPHQTDFNRAWPGTTVKADKTTKLMQEIMDYVTQKPLFAAIDIHNNTGANPHYGCITDIRKENQYICALFNHIAFVFHYPKGVSTGAFEGICPAATLECGKPGEAYGIEHTSKLIDGLLHLDHFPEKETPPHDLQLVESMATVTIGENTEFSFCLSETADLMFEDGFEFKNFSELTPNDVFAYSNNEKALKVKDPNGEDITSQIFRLEDGKVFLNKTLIPAMITTDKEVIKQDCLCYLLQDYEVKR